MLEKAMEMTRAEVRIHPSYHHQSCQKFWRLSFVPDVVQRHQQQQQQQQQLQQLIGSNDTVNMIITCTRGTRRAAAVRTIQIFSCQTCCNNFMIAQRRQAQEEQWWRRLHQEREELRWLQGIFFYSFSAPPLRETPAEVMAQLPSYPFQRISGAESVECAVCLEALQADDVARDLPCHHTFHRKCIDTWLSSNHTCPVCRQDLLKN